MSTLFRVTDASRIDRTWVGLTVIVEARSEIRCVVLDVAQHPAGTVLFTSEGRIDVPGDTTVVMDSGLTDDDLFGGAR